MVLEVDSTVSSVSMWESMVSWFTPAVLFLLLNLTIATIALSSSLSHKPTTTNTNTNGSPDHTKSPPSVIQRLRSLNLSPFRSQPSVPETHHLEQQQQQQQQQQRSLHDEVFSQMEVCHVSRTTSDSALSLPENKKKKKLPARMKKSASMKSAFGHFGQPADGAVEARRPATVRERKADADVDAKADDFINRFKNQLKLQRMDSIVRYKEMIGRGGGGAN